MKPGGFVGVGELFDGRGGVRVADRLVTQAFQHRLCRFPVANPLPDMSFLSFVHSHILPHVRSFR